MSTYQTRRKAADLARRQRDAQSIQVNAPLDKLNETLRRLSLPLPRPVPYNDDGFALLLPTFDRLVNDLSGRRAPVRKRRKRLAKKLERRGGALHYGLLVRPE